ncbi:hypothetical protein DXV75_12955 [Alteromonas aestuariivivens]|uniref:Uncharacterized protein n=1 Tax=Alteromonas aestuariivivens TaxID=1938339 RepID=A0A3D8M615_9ALTE|nr:hypothetical protein [Alteromonas aestuariivivens]RDV24602.1 hypothetical protein DXV75_12955 [Alteromonas aestuariivivens]
MNSTIEHWLQLSREELDEIYMHSEAGSLPRGDTRGTAIVAGSSCARFVASIARLLAWQGKVFDIFPPDYERGILINKVLPIGLGLIVAKVYRGESWMDGKETIVIDYSTTSVSARFIRDEIREVEPGIYLGKVWWGKTRILDFALNSHPNR